MLARMSLSAAVQAQPFDPNALRRQILDPAESALSASGRYSKDKAAYKAAKPALESHLDRVERLSADTRLSTAMRAEAMGVAAGIAGVLAAHESSISLGKRSYHLAEARADL